MLIWPSAVPWADAAMMAGVGVVVARTELPEPFHESLDLLAEKWEI